jgi:hypothetical protein
MSDNKPKKDTWSLIKETAETEEERIRHADMELNTLKNEQVFYDKTVGAFIDGFGNKYFGKDVNERNNIVRAKAVVIIKENKIKDPHYVNRFMFSKNRKWKQPEEDVGEKDWAAPILPEEQKREKKESKKIYTVQPELALTRSEYDIISHFEEKKSTEIEKKEIPESVKEKSLYDGSGITHPDVLAINKALYGKD